MMKKRVVALTTAAVMALSMTACGGGGGADKTASGDKEGGLSGEITVWSWDVALAHLEEWAEKFQEENPDVTFNFEEMGVDQVYQKMTTCLQSGIGLPDIVSIEGEQMAKFGEKFPGKFEDFTDMINPDDYFPIKISECTVDGKIIAYPWDSGPCGMFYRSDLFEEAGIKAEDIVTWDDFIEAGKVLKEQGFHFDLAFTSVLKRAENTLDYILKEMGEENIEIKRSWKLNERHYGALQGLNKDETKEKYGAEQVLLWRRSTNVRPPELEETDPRYPGNDPKYKDLTKDELPKTENLIDTIKRVVEYWNSDIKPELEISLTTNEGEGSANLTVINTVGKKLPVTGSSAAVICITTGSVLVLAGAMRRNRKNAKEKQ